MQSQQTTESPTVGLQLFLKGYPFILTFLSLRKPKGYNLIHLDNNTSESIWYQYKVHLFKSLLLYFL